MLGRNLRGAAACPATLQLIEQFGGLRQRTLVIENGVATNQAGAGNVADYVPASEYVECVNKAKCLMRALDIAEAKA